MTLLGQGQPATAGTLQLVGAGTHGPVGQLGSATRAQGVLSRGPQGERSFLAMCVASPDLGASVLSEVDPDALLLEDVLRRAARFLREHLPGPLPDSPGDDPELTLALVWRARSSTCASAVAAGVRCCSCQPNTRM